MLFILRWPGSHFREANVPSVVLVSSAWLGPVSLIHPLNLPEQPLPTCPLPCHISCTSLRPKGADAHSQAGESEAKACRRLDTDGQESDAPLASPAPRVAND